jgi:hypothetical protein
MKAKKWARKARSISVRLEGPTGDDLEGHHILEIRDAQRHILRTRTLEYRDGTPAMSTIMTDARARLAKNSLVVNEDSYELVNDGRVLRASVILTRTSKGIPIERQSRP